MAFISKCLKQTAFLVALISISMLSVEGKKRGREGQGRADVPAVLTTTTTSQPLVCPPCSEIACTPKKESKLKCKGGIKRGICDCCPVCAKVRGESCGGEFNYLGECDADLVCEENQSKNKYDIRKKGGSRRINTPGRPEGKCKEVKLREDQSNTPRTRNKDCKPRCTPTFCKENPKSLCSAVDVVDVKRPCQGKCQHTTCQACSWVEPEPDCGTCEQDDEKCIKKYAKCVKKQYCTRMKFPCKANPGIKETGKFQCLVPKCK